VALPQNPGYGHSGPDHHASSDQSVRLELASPASLLAVDEQAPATPKPIVVKVAVRS